MGSAGGYLLLRLLPFVRICTKHFLQRRYRLASDTLVYDLQFRLHCKGCNRRSGFRITIFDERTRGDSSKPRLEQVVVAWECGRSLSEAPAD